MKTWNEKIGEMDLAGKPLIRALLANAATDLDKMEHKYGFQLSPYETLEEMIEMAIAADIFNLLFPSLMMMDGFDMSGGDSFPKDRVLTFVCGLWFLSAAIPRLEEEGFPVDLNRLAAQLGSFFFMPYDEEKKLGLIKIGINYWKELGSKSPPALIEWHKSFSQMIFIHYEVLTNEHIDLGDFDLDSNIGKMLRVFLSPTFSPPSTQPES